MATADGEVPVWVNGAQKWVAGVNRRTTCEELVRVLVSAELSNAATENGESAASVDSHLLRSYTIVERWGTTERPLQPRDRILKVLRCWPQDAHHVQLLLKKCSERQRVSDHKSLRRRHQQPRHRWRSSSSLETLHPRKLAAAVTGSSDAIHQSDMVERLMRMIIAQGETIQAQLRRLQERDTSISQYEHKVHQSRVQQLGSDYLLQAYMRDSNCGETELQNEQTKNKRGNLDSSNTLTSHRSLVTSDKRRSVRRHASTAADRVSHGCSEVNGSNGEADGGEESLKNTRLMIDYLNRVADLNSHIVDKEEQCTRLRHRIRRARSSVDSKTTTDGGSNRQAEVPTAAAATISDGKESQQLLDLEVNRAELERLAAVGQRQLGAVEQTERALALADRQLEERRCYLQYLEYEMAVAEQETLKLNERLQLISSDSQYECEEQNRSLAPAPVSSTSLLSSSSLTSSSSSEGYVSGSCCAGDETAIHERQNSMRVSSASMTNAMPPTVIDKSTSTLSSQTLLLATRNSDSVGATMRSYCADKISADSNSDTGLSSLDSSGDETAATGNYMLETLV